MRRNLFENRQNHNDKSFFFTLLFTFILSSIISTLILTIFLTVNYINSITSTIKKSNQQLLSQTNFAINQMDENAERLASSFLTNSHIIAYLYSLDIESTIPVLTANDLKKQLLALSYEDFQLSSRGVAQLAEHLVNGQPQAAWSDYNALTDRLFSYSYNEIMSTIIRMVYMVYERLIDKYPMLKDTITQNMKGLLANLEYAEIADDIHGHIRAFLENTAAAIQKLKEDPAQQNSVIISEKMTAIIHNEYANPTLCLCSIADKIGLSTNYAGHIFKQCIGMSVSQYILELRMKEVARLLETTSLPLQQILEKVGLEKNNYFYTRFKNYFGIPLSEYRQKLLDASLEKA